MVDLQALDHQHPQLQQESQQVTPLKFLNAFFFYSLKKCFIHITYFLLFLSFDKEKASSNST